MFLKFVVYLSFFEIFIVINANEQFHFGIINHRTQWYFHCPGNITKLLEPPSNDQPLISYECPHRSLSMEILPIEIDFTFLCRRQSRLIWFIIDLYQYNTYFWLINSNDLEIKVNLNNKIELNNSKIELKNYTNRFIIINAFYIPFESINILLTKQIEINIQIKNLNQSNQCQFLIKDNYLWETFIENNCDSDQSKTFFIQYATCDFYSNEKQSLSEPIDRDLQVNIISTIPTSTLNQSKIIDIEQDLTTNLIPYHHHYLILQENYRQILASLSHSTTNSILLKLTIIFLIIILIILTLFFLYMLCYHYHNRSRSSLGKNTTVSI